MKETSKEASKETPKIQVKIIQTILYSLMFIVTIFFVNSIFFNERNFNKRINDVEAIYLNDSNLSIKYSIKNENSTDFVIKNLFNSGGLEINKINVDIVLNKNNDKTNSIQYDLYYKGINVNLEKNNSITFYVNDLNVIK